MVRNLVTFLDYIALQLQADAICFDLSRGLTLVPHHLLLYKLSSLGFPDGYVSWFHGYLTNRQSRVRVSGAELFPVCCRHFSWDISFRSCSFVTYVTHLTTINV
jgi:hypothetical protein